MNDQILWTSGKTRWVYPWWAYPLGILWGLIKIFFLLALAATFPFTMMAVILWKKIPRR